MRRHLFWTLSLPFACAFLFANAFASSPQTHNIQFVSGANGAAPASTLISDSAGNLYGTTTEGGSSECNYHNSELNGCGTVFELSPPTTKGGHWTYAVLHEFHYATDGDFPYSSLLMDVAGNLYGTALKGGNGNPYGPGTVYELSPPAEAGGAWTFATLYVFQSSSSTDGAGPWGALVFDQAGNLYGTTQIGGANSRGTVYELSPPSATGGSWTETVLFTFPHAADGGYPLGGVILASDGSLYGTTSMDGFKNSTTCPGGCGTIFRLSRNAGGTWTGQALHSFEYTDGATPFSSLTYFKGSYYGTTSAGGPDNEGAVFQLTPNSGGSATFTTIFNFTFDNGGIPYAGVIFDQSGNLYGTTFAGGSGGSGTVYKLTPSSGGSWSETILASFSDSGNTPEIGLIGGLLLRNNQLFGTTADCSGFDGTCDRSGYVYSITGF